MAVGAIAAAGVSPAWVALSSGPTLRASSVRCLPAPGRPASRRLVPRYAAPPLDDSKVAVLLSRNARGVTERLIGWAEGACGADNVFATNSLEEAREAGAAIVEAGYGTVISGGGDGTLAAALTAVRDARRDRWGEPVPLAGMPRFAVLPLGTGNAMARFIWPRGAGGLELLPPCDDASSPGAGSSSSGRHAPRSAWPRPWLWPGVVWRFVRGRGDETALQRAINLVMRAGAAAGRPGVTGRGTLDRVIRVPVLESDTNDLCFMAGCGFDAFLLDDFQALKKLVKRTPLKRPLSSVLGYFVAMLVFTLPRYITGRHSLRVRVSVPVGSPVFYVDPRRGDAALALAQAAEGSLTLYEGPASIVAAGTCPFLGGGMQLFPFARSAEGMMHLRIANLSPLRFVPNVMKIFRGTYRNTLAAFDFVCRACSVEIIGEHKAPFQQSGDAMGRRRGFKLHIAGSVRFLDFVGLPDPLRHLS